MSPPDRLIAAELRASLGESVIGGASSSWNRPARPMISFCKCSPRNFRKGFVVFAEHQTAGRGQRGNRWASAAHQGLWFSLLLRPQLPLAESARLTNWAAEAVAATIRSETGLAPSIKPPNDVYLGERKVAGVLVETKAGPASGLDAIVGNGSESQPGAGRFSGRATGARRLIGHGARAGS